VELVDTRDLKSLDRNIVPVQVRPRVPSKTTFSEIKQVIAQLLQQKTQKLTLIEVNDFYVFEYIDPPVVMEKKIGPKRSIICIFGALLGVILGTLMVLIRHFVREN